MANLFAYSTLEFLTWVAAILRAKGVYITRTIAKQDPSGATKATADVAFEHIQAMEAGLEAPFQPTEDDRFFAEMALENARAVEANTEFGQTLRKYADLDAIDLTNKQLTGVLASAVGMFQRKHESEKLNADLKAKGMKLNEYYGEIKKRETFIDLVVLTPSESRVGNYGAYWTAKLATPAGHWLTTYDAHPDWKANDKVSVKATVKKHFEDRDGNRWTVLGNVNNLTPEDVNAEIVKADRKAKREAKAKEPKTPEQMQKLLKAQATRERKKAEKVAAEAAAEEQEHNSCDNLEEALRMELWAQQTPHFGGTAPHRYVDFSSYCTYCRRPQWYHPPPVFVESPSADMSEVSHA